jgi:hypothetical protein
MKFSLKIAGIKTMRTHSVHTHECIRGGPSWPLHRDHSDLLCLIHTYSKSYIICWYVGLIYKKQKVANTRVSSLKHCKLTYIDSAL